ncbi:S-adenosyl-L-methionine-dependent methyltransferase [Aspergillus filifer]
MQRFPRSPAEVPHLLQLAELFKQALSFARVLLSHRLHEAQKTVLAITGAATELVAELHSRILEVVCQYFESRALFIAAERHIPDLLEAAEDNGLSLTALAESTGIGSRKLSRMLCCLCWIHIFKEIRPDVFANDRISNALIRNEALRACLPKYLLGNHGASYKVNETPWQKAMWINRARWDWLGERVFLHQIRHPGVPYPGLPDVKHLCPDANGSITRPELDNFGLAMVGGGKVFGAVHAHDFPWADLGAALVVDVGGGVGGFVLQLLPVYPQLRFLVQDRAEVLRQAETEVCPAEAPKAVKDDRVQFMGHDFFQPNPVKSADIYWLRGVLHDWVSVAPRPRIFVCDQVMNTTAGCEEIPPAPAPLTANYGYYMRYPHQRDLAMISIISGIERTRTQFANLVKQAGLKVKRMWNCQSMVGIAEIGL